MKTRLFFAVLFISFIFLNIMPACQNRERIALKDLPATAQSFIDEYFSLDSISSITLDTKDKTYKVNFLNQGEIYFNPQGLWQEVDVKRNPFPIALFDTLPAGIFSYLISTYPTKPVTTLRRTTHGYEVEIGFSSKQEILFDTKGNATKK